MRAIFPKLIAPKLIASGLLFPVLLNGEMTENERQDCFSAAMALAISTENTSLLKELSEIGDLDKHLTGKNRSWSGFTPLGYAAFHKRKTSIQWLLKCGASLEAPDQVYYRPIDWILDGENEDEEAANLLSKENDGGGFGAKQYFAKFILRKKVPRSGGVAEVYVNEAKPSKDWMRVLEWTQRPVEKRKLKLEITWTKISETEYKFKFSVSEFLGPGLGGGSGRLLSRYGYWIPTDGKFYDS